MKQHRNTHRGPRVGDMTHWVLFHDRNIEVPAFGSIDFDESFEGTADWASIKTTNGKIVMDDVGNDVNSTHRIETRFKSSVTTETFLQHTDGRRFKILSVENFDERGEFLRLFVTDRGMNEAAKA